MRTLIRLSAAAALVAMPLVACSSGSSSSGSVAGADVTVHAKDTLKFDKGEYTAKAGPLKLGYLDDGSLQHTLLIDGQSGFKLSVSGKGQSQVGEVTLAPGTYQIYCDIPGHRAAGMQANLVVS
ncbi:MAG TPA: plastocyanin/azurin family copper-binding protein [Acidimicrobiales bacterium]|jgi:plastocyanin